MSTLAEADIDAYFARLGVTRARDADATALIDLQAAHMRSVPFENLDIVFAGGVPHDRDAAVAKVLSGRGGWCFELNGALSLLLTAIGFDVRLIGAAVLLDGPSRVLEHLALEVSGGTGDVEPMLVDVGFGESFIRPLGLNRAGRQPGGDADYEFIPSPQGTTLAEYVDEVPEARFRFKRVAHDFDDFAPTATAMQVDPSRHWHRKPFATRLLGVGADRVTLTHDSLKIRTHGELQERPVDRAEWDGLLAEWFDMERPGPWPT